MTADTRRLVSRYVTSAPVPAPGEVTSWLLRNARDELARSRQDSEHRRPIRFALVAEVCSAANTYLRNFLPPVAAVFAGCDLRASAATDLAPHEQQVQQATFGDTDPRLSWWLPAGLLIDQVRTGPYWDDVVDAWMWRKLTADIAAGTALATRRGHAFLGVRVLPLNAPANAVLVTARPDGRLTASPLSTLDLAAAPVGITQLPTRRPRRVPAAGSSAPVATASARACPPATVSSAATVVTA